MGEDGCLILGNTLDLNDPLGGGRGLGRCRLPGVSHLQGQRRRDLRLRHQERMEKVARAVADHYQPDEIVILEDAA
jgi:hypothetical protein